MDTKQNDIWEMEGQRAYRAGKKLEDCPHTNVVAVREWQSGWLYAKAQGHPITYGG
jgi:ribosome modulation factor